VREQRTGSPEELAKRIGVSRVKLYLILDELRDEGVEIKFSKRLNSFVYENCAGVSVVFSLKVLESTEIRNISAGKGLNYFPASIILGGSIFARRLIQSPRLPTSYRIFTALR